MSSRPRPVGVVASGLRATGRVGLVVGDLDRAGGPRPRARRGAPAYRRGARRWSPPPRRTPGCRRTAGARRSARRRPGEPAPASTARPAASGRGPLHSTRRHSADASCSARARTAALHRPGGSRRRARRAATERCRARPAPTRARRRARGGGRRRPGRDRVPAPRAAASTSKATSHRPASPRPRTQQAVAALRLPGPHVAPVATGTLGPRVVVVGGDLDELEWRRAGQRPGRRGRGRGCRTSGRAARPGRRRTEDRPAPRSRRRAAGRAPSRRRRRRPRRGGRRRRGSRPRARAAGPTTSTRPSAGGRPPGGDVGQQHGDGVVLRHRASLARCASSVASACRTAVAACWRWMSLPRSSPRSGAPASACPRRTRRRRGSVRGGASGVEPSPTCSRSIRDGRLRTHACCGDDRSGDGADVPLVGPGARGPAGHRPSVLRAAVAW